MGQLGIILLYVAGLALVIAEIILPGVVIGLVGMGCMGAAIWLAFKQSGPFGWTLLVIALACIPVMVFLYLKVINRFLVMSGTQKGTSGAKWQPKDLVGQEGVALTPLRPAGTARIGERRVDVISDGEVIDPNTRVRVVEVKGNRVVVRAVSG